MHTIKHNIRILCTYAYKLFLTTTYALFRCGIEYNTCVCNTVGDFKQWLTMIVLARLPITRQPRLQQRVQVPDKSMPSMWTQSSCFYYYAVCIPHRPPVYHRRMRLKAAATARRNTKGMRKKKNKKQIPVEKIAEICCRRLKDLT